VRKNSGASEEGDNSAPGWKSEFVAVGTLSDGGFGGWRPSSGAKFDETRMSEAKIEILAEFSPITVRKNFGASTEGDNPAPGRKSEISVVGMLSVCWSGGWRPSSGAKTGVSRMSEAKIEILAEFSPFTVRKKSGASEEGDNSTPGGKSEFETEGELSTVG